MSPFANLTFSFTSIHDHRRQASLAHTIHSLGGAVTQSMTRFTTHLIVPDFWQFPTVCPITLKTHIPHSSGLKLLAACKWNTNVVFASWIDACARSNRHITHDRSFFLDWVPHNVALIRAIFDTPNPTTLNSMTRLDSITSSTNPCELPSSEMNVCLFAGMYFLAEGLPDDRSDNLRILVIEHGGHYLYSPPLKFLTPLVHVVIPVSCKSLDSILHSYSEPSNPHCEFKFVSDTWVHHCLLDQTIHPIDHSPASFLYVPHCPSLIPELNGKLVTTTGFSMPDTRALELILADLGATYSPKLTRKCHVVIYAHPKGSKFAKAHDFGIPAVPMAWVQHAVSSKTYPNPDTYRPVEPIFTNTTLCLTSKVKSLGTQFRHIAELHGAQILLAFARTCTHVVHVAPGVQAPTTHGEVLMKSDPTPFGIGTLSDHELRLAQVHGVHVVSPWWIIMSVQANRRLPEHDFPPTLDPNRQLVLQTSKTLSVDGPSALVPRGKRQLDSNISHSNMPQKRWRPSVITRDSCTTTRKLSFVHDSELWPNVTAQKSFTALDLRSEIHVDSHPIVVQHQSPTVPDPIPDLTPDIPQVPVDVHKDPSPETTELGLQQAELIATVERMLANLGQQPPLVYADMPARKPYFENAGTCDSSPEPNELWLMPEDMDVFSKGPPPVITYDDPVATKARRKLLAMAKASPCSAKPAATSTYPKIWNSGPGSLSSGLSKHPFPSDSAAVVPGTLDSGVQSERLPEKKGSVSACRKIAFSGILEKRTEFEGVVTRLGGVVMQNEVVSSKWVVGTTHLVILVPITCEKCMCAIASGAWLLRPSYVEASRDALQWVDEREHSWGAVADLDARKRELDMVGAGTEQFDQKKAMDLIAGWHRWFRVLYSQSMKGAFDGWRVLLLNQPRNSSYPNVLTAGGAVLVESWDPATEPEAVTHVLVHQSVPNLPFLAHPIARTRTHPAGFALQHLLGDRPPTPPLIRRTSVQPGIPAP